MNDFFSSLYVHVPFCIKKCRYCGFFSIRWTQELEDLYLQGIIKEILITSQFPHSLKTIYIGGGTPSCLSNKGLINLLEKIGAEYRKEKECEFTVEINPATVNPEKLRILKEMGVNRLSIGVQSLEDRELRILGRIHDSKQALDTLRLVIEEGFENISADLIYGIPFQSIDSWRKTLRELTKLPITHISLYELSVEENTELKNDIELRILSLPRDEDTVEMYFSATDFLGERGFIKYEISNFARSSHECLHNLNYWRIKPYLGIGPSSHSLLNRRRLHNPSDLFLYLDSLKSGKLAWKEDYELTPTEELKEKVFLGLRTKGGIIVKSRCLLSFFRDFEREQLVKISGERVSLTDKGMVLSNELFVRVLSHIENCLFCKQESVSLS